MDPQSWYNDLDFSSRLISILRKKKTSNNNFLGSFALSNEGICRIDDFEKIGKFNALSEAITRKSYP